MGGDQNQSSAEVERALWLGMLALAAGVALALLRYWVNH